MLDPNKDAKPKYKKNYNTSKNYTSKENKIKINLYELDEYIIINFNLNILINSIKIDELINPLNLES